MDPLQPTPVLLSGTLSDLTRSRSDLLAENALLRQQSRIVSLRLEAEVMGPAQDFTRDDRADSKDDC